VQGASNCRAGLRTAPGVFAEFFATDGGALISELGGGLRECHLTDKRTTITARAKRQASNTRLRIGVTFPLAGVVQKPAHASIRPRRLSNRSPRRYLDMPPRPCSRQHAQAPFRPLHAGTPSAPPPNRRRSSGTRAPVRRQVVPLHRFIRRSSIRKTCRKAASPAAGGTPYTVHFRSWHEGVALPDGNLRPEFGVEQQRCGRRHMRIGDPHRQVS
jgi:hypothetical protein